MTTLTKSYTLELKEEVVELVLAQGLSIEQAAARVSIPKGTLANWVAAAKTRAGRNSSTWKPLRGCRELTIHHKPSTFMPLHMTSRSVG